MIITLVNFLRFILQLVHYLSDSSETKTEWISNIVYYLASGLLFQVLLTSVLEFMCAQSPYNMRGLLVSFIVVWVFISATLGATFHSSLCTKRLCSLIIFSAETALCLIGFILFCVVARWYKRRVRDDEYSPQIVIEEVYDRYLTAAAAHSS